MTASLFLVYRSAGQVSSVNGVRHVLVNKPHGTAAADVIASAVSAANAAYNNPGSEEALDYATQDAFGAKYFDTVVEIAEDSAALIAGQLATDKHAYVLDPASGPVAATAAV